MFRLIALLLAIGTLGACEMNRVSNPAAEAGDARNDLDEQEPNIKS